MSCRWLIALLLGLCILMQFAASGAAFRADFDLLRKLAGDRYGQKGQQVMQDWRNLLDSIADIEREGQLEQLNQFINRRVFYMEDPEIWGEADYWATPLETLGRGAGDCEDSAIAKYVSLLSLGVPDAQLRLTYVRAKFDGQTRAHMVLSYYPAADREPLILDSLHSEILPASRRKDLFPIYSFNASGLWVAGKSLPEASPTARLSNWRSVLARMQQEGWR